MIQLSDRFVLLREIGSGGMSRVFLGRDEVLDRPVAVKVLKTGYAGTETGARFRREGRTAARLSHPNIVQVFDAGEGEFEGEEASYIVMEYVSGGDLKALVDERGTLSEGRISGIGAEVAAGLSHAHERGIVHRDVKPHNILLEEKGRARLTDFGIARAVDATQATRTGFYLGTALYSSPEQLRGEGVTQKSDVYSLGVTLYQAAAGEPPFTGAPIEIASQHISREPTPPRKLNPEISRAMEALILACMSKSPDARPTADEVRTRLLESGRGNDDTRAYEKASVRQPAPRSRVSPRSAVGEGRRRSGVLLALAAVLAVIALLGALAASTLPGGIERADQGAGQNARQDQQAGRDGGPSGGQTATPRGSSQAASQDQASADPVGSDPSGGPAEMAAVRTVEDHYAVAASDDYQAAWTFLSSSYQRELGSRGKWTGQFRTLKRVEYTRGPRARVVGDTATVSFSTLAYHADRMDEVNGAVMYLVRENGEWKIDGLEA